MRTNNIFQPLITHEIVLHFFGNIINGIRYPKILKIC